MRKRETYIKFINDFERVICKSSLNQKYSSIIFLCIGTDRITGDSFGPLVGYNLKKFYACNKIIKIVGDLENTVQSNNIEDKYNQIMNTYKKPFIISIDSALSAQENIGKIIVEEGGIELGSGLRKNKMSIGDMSIKGIVARNTNNSRCNFAMLQNTHLGLIISMVEIVANGIYNTFTF